MSRITTFALFFLSVPAFAAAASAQDAAPPRDEAPKRGLIRNEAGAFQGFTLFAPLSAGSTYLVDMAGEIVHRWESDLAPTGTVYLLDDGHLLRPERIQENDRFRGGGIGGRLRKFDWDGNIVWDYTLADDYQTMHHDIEPLPNGNVLVIVWEHRFREDAIASGRDPQSIGENGIWPDAILELAPLPPDDAEVVWEWHAWDHLIQDFDPELEGYGPIPDHPERIDINGDHRLEAPLSDEERERQIELEAQMEALGYVGGGSDDEEEEDATPTNGSAPDWLHTNSVDYHAGLDLIILSSPEFDEVWVIDHSLSTEDTAWNTGGRWGKGGGILYRWGHPMRYGRGTEADRRFFYQHDPSWIAGDNEGELRYIVFNNGGGRPGGDASSVEEFILPFDPARGFQRDAGQAFGPAEPVWSYRAEGFFSSFISGAQRLPNGNTLICEGASGRLLEVTRAKEVVWEYVNPLSGTVETGPGGNAPPTALFRATRIAPDHPGLARLAR